MRLLFSTIFLSLAWFAAVNLVLSGAAWLWAIRVAARDHSGDGARAWALLVVRLLPAALALFTAAALFAPAHWALEPRGVDERFGIALSVLAFVGAALLIRAVLRAAHVARAAVRVGACLRATRPGLTSLLRTDPPTVELNGLDGISLAGVTRPCVLIGTRVRKALSAAELDVAIAHETAHYRAQDNLKRVAMFCAPDLLGVSAAGRRLEASWRAEAECLADSRAVAGDDERAMCLASALVKVAMLGARRSPLNAPVWSTFHEALLLETRVRRLVDGTHQPARAQRSVALGGGVLTTGVLASAWMLGLPQQLHRATEAVVHLLP
ncbi:MAG: hypothetical protein LC753_16325 [Acidobacteria bacterium]|nr:hypothetical protein [Acidobacteriota bacterium]MCA1651761.1 hypothetical protein [Acidobacteriota bacterium]